MEIGVGVWIVIGGALLLAVLGFVWPEFFSLPVAVGALLGIILAYLGYRVALTRLMALAILAGILSLVTIFINLGEIAGTTVVFAGTELGLILSGGLALRSYLQHNPPPDEGDR